MKEFGWDCKDEFSKRLNEYRLEVENDKYHYVGAVVNHEKRLIEINEYYNKDMEILLCTIVHELLHILSNKGSGRNNFVEEGTVELLTYKILCKKVSQKTLAKYFERSGYEIGVCVMDTVYLLDKNIILSYIRDKDGYDFRFAGRVFNDGGAFSQNRRHQNIFRAGDGHHVGNDAGGFKSL